ncbi:hypothetical protein NDU88_001845 [Pleurodeles waltl]|uniref:Uncharacterized protein n=1 Tax=Pleurodeles waltl TaxID=8319 RepID=A0AAV7VAU2_PLEWA|nr:hypothetical protein NDU88_001845 [Pleurodeles waltl]
MTAALGKALNYSNSKTLGGENVSEAPAMSRSLAEPLETKSVLKTGTRRNERARARECLRARAYARKTASAD